MLLCGYAQNRAPGWRCVGYCNEGSSAVGAEFSWWKKKSRQTQSGWKLEVALFTVY